jgi:hypothetical protein
MAHNQWKSRHEHGRSGDTRAGTGVGPFFDDLVGREAKPMPGPIYTGFRTRPRWGGGATSLVVVSSSQRPVEEGSKPVLLDTCPGDAYASDLPCAVELDIVLVVMTPPSEMAGGIPEFVIHGPDALCRRGSGDGDVRENDIVGGGYPRERRGECGDDGVSAPKLPFSG